MVSIQTAPAPVAGPSAASAGPSATMWVSVAICVGFGVGLLTASGQGWLGDSTSSLANSAGPWSLTAFAVARYSRRVLSAVAGATLTLACSEFGYVIATEFRGGSNATSTVVFWLSAAVLAGAPLGVAAAWSRRRGVLRSIGLAVIAGVLLGEGVYGWTTVADTTDWRYWAIEMVVGVGVVTFVVRGRRFAHSVAAIGAAAVTAIVLLATARIV